MAARPETMTRCTRSRLRASRSLLAESPRGCAIFTPCPICSERAARPRGLLLDREAGLGQVQAAGYVLLACSAALGAPMGWPCSASMSSFSLSLLRLV